MWQNFFQRERDVFFSLNVSDSFVLESALIGELIMIKLEFFYQKKNRFATDLK